MLGRLLNTAAATLNPTAYSAKNPQPLESVTEEEHTSGLLYPDVSLLRRSNSHAYPLHTAFNSPNTSTAGGYDDRGGGVELDHLKDFRVIIAQNALGDRDACVLLDTRATPQGQRSHGLGLEPQVFENTGTRHARTLSTLTRGPRRGYLPQSSVVESSPLSAAAETRRSPPMFSGAFMRARVRSSTLAPGGNFTESGHSRGTTDANDSGLLNCIFGSSAFSYKGSSTKMHIISADDEPSQTSPASPAARSSLSRAYTTGSSTTFGGSDRGNESKPPAKVTILLTRMFSVHLPEGGDDDSSPDRPDLSSSVSHDALPSPGFPFPDVSKRKKIKEKKTPMYAVAITIQIPLLSRNGGRPVSRFAQGPDSPKPGLSCSLDSDHRWRGGFFEDSLSHASPPASLDERIDLLVDHWDIINRTLSHLERLSRNEILFLLKKVDASAGPHPKPAKPPNMQRTNQTFVHLPVNVLSINSKLRDEAIRSTRRISTALQMPYVVTGQSRWGVWREEGRSIIRSLGDKDHSFFFLVLVTAFLGNHTEWLNAVGPEWYRRRHYLQQKAQQDADPMLANRTVIISPDKMTARRLIFLLAAFLPPKQRFEPLPSPIRPGTAASTRAVSQSPPNVPILRQEALRRVMERRSRAQRLNLNEREQHQRSVSASSNETAHRSAEEPEPMIPPDFGAKRRGSDARSIRALGVPIHTRDMRPRNTSAATTSTTTPSSTVPVPHFASQSRSERMGSDPSVAEGRDSLASETLLKNLRRSETSATCANGQMPPASGRWGTLFSGLWSSRQESSDAGDAPAPSEARKRSVSAYTNPPRRNPPTLAQMVKEASEEPMPAAPKATTSGNISIPPATNSHISFEEDAPDLSSTTDQTRESSLRMAVRGDDGVVDVDLPLPGFLSLSSSGDSTLASPKKTRTSVTSMDAMASTQSSVSGFHGSLKDNDGPNTNVAGWLRTFHDDFLLQAVRPYASLEADIKRAMQAEPTPSQALCLNADGSERWVDVATTVIADVRNFTVKRLRLRRKLVGHGSSRKAYTPSFPSQPGTPRYVSNGSVSASQLTSFFSHATGSSKTSNNSSMDDFYPTEVEERFVEEPVMDLDGTLVDALERVLAQSGPSSMVHSRAPSPSRGRRGEDKQASDAPAPTREEIRPVEVPRTECRKLVLGALEEVVRSVTAEHCREDVDGELGLADRERKRTLAGADNTLREGVRKWLLDVEEAW
ncbi:uncharacterized protein BO72DRAFT_462012 [Aspergillus fijiensis CBS 313.89]|uniref:Folliculin-interacting protein N-terminal domain-containing protein n=1 Tax=Aspergillus fijiensis CBS 313.89 TaxID=1448319 RepID=A0A8G1RLG6_9EURO|nr:uncharacterized protein BO72DRAFT_462012 [Aspergillus fijiensis CBS 313.89]RAK73601.1 hypothetical protein BO72DRAFT_462012 [Aspergillus fijiensis CBS 313.89]